MVKVLFAIVIFLFCFSAEGVYSAGKKGESELFLDEIFSGSPPLADNVWISSELRLVIEKILSHKTEKKHIRYWKIKRKTVWIISEIVKNKYIKAGIVINDSRIDNIKVLECKDKKGGQVRYGSFLGQFTGVMLDNEKNMTRRIDGVSGATLSSNAMIKLAHLALYLDCYVNKNKDG